PFFDVAAMTRCHQQLLAISPSLCSAASFADLGCCSFGGWTPGLACQRLGGRRSARPRLFLGLPGREKIIQLVTKRFERVGDVAQRVLDQPGTALLTRALSLGHF